jgi:hypothetical protein
MALLFQRPTNIQKFMDTTVSIYIRAVKIEREGEQYGTYYQAVRSYREQGKAKQEVFHLGEHQTAEEAPSSQTDEDLARTPLKPLPQLHRIV